MIGYLGEIRYYAGPYVPQGWAFCNGQPLVIDDYQALYAILSDTYTSTAPHGSFNLPNLNGKAAIGAGQAEGLSNYTLGSQTGTETVTLTQAQMPTHTHDAEAKVEVEINLVASGMAYSDDPEVAYLGNIAFGSPVVPYAPSSNGNMKSSDLDINVSLEFGAAGNSEAHANMQPYMGINFIICIEGYYPQGA
ncbi:MAG: tail fiber protein [Flavipsychrobacter sp.]